MQLKPVKLNELRINMFAKVFAFLLVVASVSAFAPARMASKAAMKMSVFDNAVNDWAKAYPEPYAMGWGPTTKAERWNGRHAMFGWVALLVTGYAKGHGLIPNADTLLDLKEWGTLAYLYGGSITNERAIIIVAHLHLLLFSACAAVAPLSTQDKLYLTKGETAEPAAGLIPAIVPGLSKEAEMLNGRLAMLGLTSLVTFSLATQTPVLDVVNAWLGGRLF